MDNALILLIVTVLILILVLWSISSTKKYNKKESDNLMARQYDRLNRNYFEERLKNG